jgi:hypothetical protein
MFPMNRDMPTSSPMPLAASMKYGLPGDHGSRICSKRAAKQHASYARQSESCFLCFFLCSNKERRPPRQWALLATGLLVAGLLQPSGFAETSPLWADQIGTAE